MKDVEKEKLSLEERHQLHREYMWPQQHWRSWGSWFSWGSATGLGLFFVLTAFAIWICFHL